MHARCSGSGSDGAGIKHGQEAGAAATEQ
jgi:hypothetical protein